MGTKCICSPPSFATGCHFRCRALWEAYSASPDLAKFQTRRKEEQERKCVKHGWSSNGRRGRDGVGVNGRGSTSAPREVHSKFLAAVGL